MRAWTVVDARPAVLAVLGGLLLAVGAWIIPAVEAAQRPDLLAQARSFYNQGRHDEAIAAAAEAVETPAMADAAALVLGRAHIERYRRSAEPTDLEAARAALRGLNPLALSPRDRVELVIGLGEVVYHEGQFGAAAQLFESVLDRGPEWGIGARDRLLDWWATAIDRDVQKQGPAERAVRYGMLASEMRAELRRDPESVSAGYWLVAALRGAGDMEGAWNAAVAAWLRAVLAQDRGAAQRADLDRLMRDAIIPERARLLHPGRTAEQAAAALTTEWEEIKERWTRK